MLPRCHTSLTASALSLTSSLVASLASDDDSAMVDCSVSCSEIKLGFALVV